MHPRVPVLQRLYDRFNARDVDGVLASLAPDVAWANGMDGGHVHGHEALRAYWTRQWALVSPHVAPVRFDEAPGGAIVATVVQTIRDLDGNPIAEADHGLRDKTVGHVFHFRGDEVARFDIQEE